MLFYNLIQHLFIILVAYIKSCHLQTQPPQTGTILQQNVYTFIKQYQQTSRFGELLDRIAQFSNDRTVIQALSGELNQNMFGSNGFTLFVPSNDALSQIPQDQEQLRNDIYNFIIKDRLSIDRLKESNGLNMTKTFGFKPNLVIRVVKNFYSRQYDTTQPKAKTQSNFQQPQINPQQQNNPNLMNNMNNMNMNPQMTTQPYQSKKYPRQNTPYPFPGQTTYRPYGPNRQDGSTWPGSLGQTTIYPGMATNQPYYPGQSTPSYYPGMSTQSYYPGMSTQSYYPGQQNLQANNNLPYNPQSDMSIYDIYSQMYGGQQSTYSGPNISPKLPMDELFLINNAIILDKFECTNGIVYLLNSYPRYFDKGLLNLLQTGEVNGLSQNLNFWITRASQSFRLGDENLKNALNAFGPNTFFLPTDQAFTKYNDRDKLNNATFLFEYIFRSHRISNQNLFDYYLDDPSTTYFTDTGLPVSTRHRRVNGMDEIEISIGHVKGRILPEFRNIYCGSGVVHLIDTVLGVPSKNAYQELSMIPELSTFRSIVDRSTTYRQLLDQTPNTLLTTTRPYYPMRQGTKRSNTKRKRQFQYTSTQYPNQFSSTMYPGQTQYPNQFTSTMYPGQQTQFPGQQTQYPGQSYTTTQSYYTQNQFGFGDAKYLTILAPSDVALIGIKDEILNNASAIDQFLSAHIIQDNSNRVFYTDHDDSIFQNGQTYSTMNPSVVLTATVVQDPNMISNIVSFKVVSNPAIRTTISNGNSRVSNGVIHIVDKPITQLSSTDITLILDKYASVNNPGQPAFSQFVDALRSTGIFNDLKTPAKKYTLFIPTNEALARYQEILNSADLNKKKQLIYRHMCLDQNLQSTYLLSGDRKQFNSYQPQMYGNDSNQLICRNMLGQDLTLTKDQYGLISKWQGMAQSKVINDFSGLYSSAYLLENPLLNNNLPNFGLNSVNSARTNKIGVYSIVVFLILSFGFTL